MTLTLHLPTGSPCLTGQEKSQSERPVAIAKDHLYIRLPCQNLCYQKQHGNKVKVLSSLGVLSFAFEERLWHKRDVMKASEYVASVRQNICACKAILWNNLTTHCPIQPWPFLDVQLQRLQCTYSVLYFQRAQGFKEFLPYQHRRPPLINCVRYRNYRQSLSGFQSVTYNWARVK